MAFGSFDRISMSFGDGSLRGTTVPLVALGEVHGFSEDPPITQEQVDRAAASLATCFEQLPEDERAVIAHLLHQAAEAGGAAF